MRRTIIRAAVVVVIILICVFLYNIGKAHTFLPENKTIELDGTKYRDYSEITISIDGGDELELYPRDRLKAEVSGQSHKIKIKAVSRSGEEIEVTKRFRVNLRTKMYLLNLPALLGENENWLQEFTPLNQR